MFGTLRNMKFIHSPYDAKPERFGDTLSRFSEFQKETKSRLSMVLPVVLSLQSLSAVYTSILLVSCMRVFC